MSLKTNSVSSGYSTGVINSNFKKIEDYVNDNLLNRDGVTPGEPNQMEVDLDMNSQDILNVRKMDAKEIDLDGIPIKEFLDDTVGEATQEADRAKQEADRAERVVEDVENALDEKVDKEEGMGLSSNNFTDPLRDKLIGLEGTHWRGTFVSLAALQSGVTDPAAGDYADVDAVGDDVARYIWDATDGIWVVQSGEVAPITATQVKQLYESNPDTNAFTDADEAKLGDVQPWATAPTLDAAQTSLGLGTAATRDVGTSSGQVPEFVSNGEGLGGLGYGRVGTSVGRYTDVNDVPKRTGFYLLTEGHPNSTNNKAPLAGFYDTSILRSLRQSSNDFVDVYLPYPNYSPGMVIAPHTSSGYATQRIVSDSINIRTSTGNSTIYPMSQKAVTDALQGKEQSLVAGTNISIDRTDPTNPVISTTGSAGTEVNVQTGTAYTLVLADAFNMVTMDNAGTNTLTVPPNSAVSFPANTRIDLGQDGVGQTTIVAGAGVTIRTPETLKLRKQWSKASLIRRAENVWDLVGDLEAEA